MTQTLAGFGLLAMSLSGWGRLAVRIVGAGRPETSDTAVVILLGWALSLLVLQVLNLFVPINLLVSLGVFVAGALMCCASWHRVNVRAWLRHSMRKQLGLALLFLPIAAWVASRGMFKIENFDSGLYHLQTIEWLNHYHIVPGLGNLHGRLAFNQSFFSYAAALNASLFFEHARGAANGFLLLLVMYQAVQGLASRTIDSPGDDSPFRLERLASFFLIPALVYIALSTAGLGSPTPDLAVSLLQLSVFLLLVRAAAERNPRALTPFAAAALPTLAATAITVKLTAIAFSSAAVAVLLVVTARAQGRDFGFLARSARQLTLPAVIIGIWMLRGIILSGCPLYPATIGCLPVDWAVPVEKVTETANWVYSWARAPGADWHGVLGNWRWLSPWAARVVRDLIGFVFPLAAFLLMTTAILFRQISRREHREEVSYVASVLVIPVTTAITFWFLTAPDLRFGRTLFWILSISSALTLAASVRGTVRPASRRALATLLFTTLNAPFFAYFVIKGGFRLGQISTSGWQAVPSPAVLARTTSSGLTVYVPATGEQCWESSLPCTPYFNPNLELRVENRLDLGFVDPGDSSRSGATATDP